LKNNLSYNRICFTFSKGNQVSKENHVSWNSVRRNRAKRLGREAYRLIKPRLTGGNDLILLVYPETEMALSHRIGQLRFLFKKAGLLK